MTTRRCSQPHPRARSRGCCRYACCFALPSDHLGRIRPPRCPSNSPCNLCWALENGSDGSVGTPRCHDVRPGQNRGRATRSLPICGQDSRIQNHLAVDRRSRGPADHFARETTHDDRRVLRALPSPNMGDIRDPGLVAARHVELALQDIRNQDRRLGDRPSWDAVALRGKLTIFRMRRSTRCLLQVAPAPRTCMDGLGASSNS